MSTACMARTRLGTGHRHSPGRREHSQGTSRGVPPPPSPPPSLRVGSPRNKLHTVIRAGANARPALNQESCVRPPRPRDRTCPPPRKRSAGRGGGRRPRPCPPPVLRGAGCRKSKSQPRPLGKPVSPKPKAATRRQHVRKADPSVGLTVPGAHLHARPSHVRRCAVGRGPARACLWVTTGSSLEGWRGPAWGAAGDSPLGGWDLPAAPLVARVHLTETNVSALRVTRRL